MAAELEQFIHSAAVSKKYQTLLIHFYEQLQRALSQAHCPLKPFYHEFSQFLHLLQQQIENPFTFQPYHQKIREPFDFYRFGLNFVRLLIDIPQSKVFGLDVVSQIEARMKQGENVVLLANHQTETDPQAIAVLLEKSHPYLAERIIYVAGERVTTDPFAIPFSMGCDLLCIYSKRYIDHPIELKAQKQIHNQHTMERMSRLLKEGGKAIYVAPSGGRDRRGALGAVEVAPFDPQSIEMFYLMAKKAKTPTHFYPLTLATYDLFPPPETIQIELGEKRSAHFTSIQLSFSPEFDMESFPGATESDKNERRKNRAAAIWNIVNQEYRRLTS